MRKVLTCNGLLRIIVGLTLSGNLGNYPTCVLAAPTSLHELHHSPSPYECAVLSAHAYQEDVQVGDNVILDQDDTQHNLQDWVVSHVFPTTQEGKRKRKKRKQTAGGYKGVLYINKRKRQMVLAHRGTVFNPGALKTDIRAIAQNIISGQERLLPQVLNQSLTVAAQEAYPSLTVTGHSLGGWLAQLTVFLAQDTGKQRNKIHVKAITFDTPGARPMLEQMNPKNDAIDIGQLDIINYLSSPNPINACNLHVGALYRIVFKNFSAIPAKYTLQSHGIHNFLNAFEPTTGIEKKCVLVRSWPLISKEELKRASKGLTNMLDGNLFSAMGNFLAVLKSVHSQELMGHYSSFFRFAQQTNHYHPDGLILGEDSKENFEMKYKYHYHTVPFDPSFVPRHHLPPSVHRLILDLQQGGPGALTIVDQDKDLYDLGWKNEQGGLRSLSGADIRSRVDQLCTVALHYANSAATHDSNRLQSKNIQRLQLSIPPLISFFIDRQKIHAQLERAYQDKTKRSIQLLTGFGGIGKTQLARKFYQTVQERGEYVHVFWLSAESREQLISAYLEIAEGLGGIYIDKQDIEKTISKVRARLADMNCFYVFDNATNAKAIRSFLPLQRGHVLITSRNNAATDWEHGTKQLQLGPLDEEEILALAQKFECPLSTKDKITLKYLLEHLSYPLVMTQFLSFCKTRGHQPAEFVRALQRQPLSRQEEEIMKLLGTTPTGNINYDKSLLQVLRICLQQIRETKYGNNAIDLLSQLAYLDPKEIPVAWICRLLPEDSNFQQGKTRDSLALLAQYCLVQWNRDDAQVYIHEVTQQIIRHLHPQQSLDQLVNKLLKYVGEKDNLSLCIPLLPHGRILFQRLDSKQHPQEATALAEYLARTCHQTAIFEEAAQWSEACLSMSKVLHADQPHPHLAHAFSLHGLSLVELGQYEEALRHRQKALEIQQTLWNGQEYPDVARAMSDMASSLSHLGRRKKALDYQQAVLAMRKRLWPNQNHPEIAYTLNSVGELLNHIGEHDKAIQYKKEALAMRQQLFPGCDRRDTARSLVSVGIGYEELNNLEKALKYKQQALEMRQRLFLGQDHPHTAHSLNNVGETLVKLGELEANTARMQEGLRACQAALAMRKRMYGENRPQHYIAYSLNSVGVALNALNKPSEGLKYAQEALDMLEKAHRDRDHDYKVRTLRTISDSYVKLGKTEKGKEYREKAAAMQERLKELRSTD